MHKVKKKGGVYCREKRGGGKGRRHGEGKKEDHEKVGGVRALVELCAR